MSLKEAASCPTAWEGASKVFRDMLAPVKSVYTIVEIGVHWGYSLFHLADSYQEALVFGIDCFGMGDSDDARKHLMAHLPKFKNIRFIEATSEKAAKDWKHPNNYLDIDILHIDGDHSYESVKRDFELWEPFVISGGAIMFHDIYSNPNSVGKFFNELEGHKVTDNAQGPGLGVWFKNDD